MADWEPPPPSVELRRIADALADAATLHQPGAVPRFPIGTVADLRRLIKDIEAMEREMARLTLANASVQSGTP